MNRLTRTLQGTLDGRAVELREVSVGVALEAGKQSGGDGMRSALFVLVHSAHWLDTGEPVFVNIDDVINDWPMRMVPEINELATLSGRLNIDGDKPEVPISNGNGAAVAAPSH